MCWSTSGVGGGGPCVAHARSPRASRAWEDTSKDAEGLMAKVAIIGAGVMGLATARALARCGHEVVVYEQFERGHTRGSSHGRSRIFRLAYSEPQWVRLAQEALAGWRELEAESSKQVL